MAGLSRKRMAAGVLLRDVQGRVLLVEPPSKPNWKIPGGAVEADESPWAYLRHHDRDHILLRLPYQFCGGLVGGDELHP